MPTTPNMNLNLPSPTVTTGPAWASDINTALTTVDAHDHSSGNGQQVTTAGLNINADLSISSNKLTDAKAVALVDNASPLSGVTNLQNVHVSGGNLYYVNSGGVAVQITSGNNIISNVVIPSSPLMPSGTVLDYCGLSVPVGFLAADGSAVSRTTYADLFTAISTSYGVGDGSTTFNLPNFNGRTAIGNGTYTDSVSGSVSRTVGQSIGAEKHVLTVNELATHTHVQNAHQHEFTNAYPGSSSFVGGYASTAVPGSQLTSATVATNQNTGLSQAHNNMQPSLVVRKIIKT